MLAALVLLLLLVLVLLWLLVFLLVVFGDGVVDVDQNPVTYEVFEARGLANLVFYEVFVMLLLLKIGVELPGPKTV